MIVIFNQMLDLPIADKTEKLHISDLADMDLAGLPIATRQHCYGLYSRSRKQLWWCFIVIFDLIGQVIWF